METESSDIREVIDRLKKKLELKYDADLARKLDIESTYLGAMKSRGEFTGTALNAIFKLCNSNDIDLNYIFFGDSAKKKKSTQPNNTTSNSNEITLAPLKEIKDIVNLSWIIREIGVPKGTFVGWMRRNDNLLETKNDVPAHYRREILYKLIFTLERLKGEIENVIQAYKEKIKQIKY